jgi:glycosyltransferase involved in cell wall biosynthesis
VTAQESWRIRHEPLRGVRVLHLGHFDPEYSRNRIVAKALRRAGAEVRTATDPRRFAFRTPKLVREIVQRHERPDVVLIGFPGHADVPVARAVSRGRIPIVFDAFLSLYEMSVEDRVLVRPGSARARALAFEDRLACTSATRVLLDTHAHIEYFVGRFGLEPERFRRVWVGADDELVRPQSPPQTSRFRVFMYASFIPLHGVEHVVRAAALLEASNADVEFEIVGAGLTERPVRELAARLGVRTVHFHQPRPYRTLVQSMAASDVCLGVFGTSPKTERVIPNKVFDALAAARPVITADTAAAREALTHADTAWLCPAGDAEAVADAIVRLQGDGALRTQIAQRGHVLFRAEFSIDAIARSLTSTLTEVLDR